MRGQPQSGARERRAGDSRAERRSKRSHSTKPRDRTSPRGRTAPSGANGHPLRRFQQAHGNQATRRLLDGPVRAKLRVGRPNDPAEREAERVAASVTRTGEPATDRSEAVGPDGDALYPRRERPPGAGRSVPVSDGVASEIEQARGGGKPLPAATRAFFEPRLGGELDDVRVHDGERAAASNRALGARAFTVGRDVFFDANEYSPESLAGRRLLAHELTHVLQQRGTDAGGRPTVATDGSPLVQRSVPGSAPSAASQRQLAEFRSMVEQFRRLQATGELSSEEVAEVESAIREAEAAVRNAREVRGAGSSLRAASGVALGATGVLVADDATGIGVADDVAIPFTLLAAGVLAAGAWALGSSEREIRQSGEAAERAVSEAISAIGQILLAKRVGEQVRSLTGQVAIHLARFLGEAVGGRPPDHQNDPENDRPHWWREIKNFVRQIKDKGLSDRQLLRELRKRFSDEQLGEIRRALREVARRMGEDPPNFPPAVP